MCTLIVDIFTNTLNVCVINTVLKTYINLYARFLWSVDNLIKLVFTVRSDQIFFRQLLPNSSTVSEKNLDDENGFRLSSSKLCSMHIYTHIFISCSLTHTIDVTDGMFLSETNPIIIYLLLIQNKKSNFGLMIFL